MFCPKCGTKAIEGADFCQRCGAKLIKDESVKPMPIEVPKPSGEPENTHTAKQAKQAASVTVSPAVQEAYDRLTASTAQSSKIKKIAIVKAPVGTSDSALTFYGMFHKYMYFPIEKTGEIRFSWNLRGILYLIYFPILLCDALFLQFFFQEEYSLLLSICCLVGCIAWFPFLVFSYRERVEITTHINNTLNCEVNVPSKISTIVVGALNLVEMGLCIASLLFIFHSGEVSNTTPDNASSNLDESFSFTDTQPTPSDARVPESTDAEATDTPTGTTDDGIALSGSTIRFDTEFYSLELPEYWADLCVYSQWDIEPYSYGITFYESQSYNDFGGEGGALFSLALYHGDEYYDFPDYWYLGEITVIRLATYDIVATFPTDVQFSEAGQENYLRLSKDIADILASFTPQPDLECEYTPAA